MNKKKKTNINEKPLILIITPIIACAIIINIFGAKENTQNSIRYNAKIKEAMSGEENAAIKEIGANGKISSLQIIKNQTEINPFDDDEQKNNNSADNKSNQITWTVEITTELKEEATSESYQGGIIEVQAELPDAYSNLVKWEPDSMPWAENTNVSNDGTTFTGQYVLSTKEVTVPGKQTLTFVLNVLENQNELEIKPTFTMNLVGNEESDKVIITDNLINIDTNL